MRTSQVLAQTKARAFTKWFTTFTSTNRQHEVKASTFEVVWAWDMPSSGVQTARVEATDDNS
jgi:hypothetical protein